MKPDQPHDAKQGEGDRVSARHHGDRLRAYVTGGKVEPAARDAEAHVARDPDDAARAARKARRGPTSTWVSVDELVAMGRTVAERVRPVVAGALGRLRSRLGGK